MTEGAPWPGGWGWKDRPGRDRVAYPTRLRPEGGGGTTVNDVTTRIAVGESRSPRRTGGGDASGGIHPTGSVTSPADTASSRSGSWKPARSPGGGAAMAPRGGSGGGVQAATSRPCSAASAPCRGPAAQPRATADVPGMLGGGPAAVRPTPRRRRSPATPRRGPSSAAAPAPAARRRRLRHRHHSPRSGRRGRRIRPRPARRSSRRTPRRSRPHPGPRPGRLLVPLFPALYARSVTMASSSTRAVPAGRPRRQSVEPRRPGRGSTVSYI